MHSVLMIQFEYKKNSSPHFTTKSELFNSKYRYFLIVLMQKTITTIEIFEIESLELVKPCREQLKVLSLLEACFDLILTFHENSNHGQEQGEEL